jgi:hypothetical protein
VLIEGAAGDAGQLGHARGSEPAVALLGERFRRRLEQPLRWCVRTRSPACRGAGGQAHGGAEASRRRVGSAVRRSAAARSSSAPVSRGTLPLEQDARPLEGAFGGLLAEVGADAKCISSGSASQSSPGSPSPSASQTQDSIPPTTKTPVASGGAAAGSMSARALSIARRGRSTTALVAGQSPARRRSAPRRRAPRDRGCAVAKRKRPHDRLAHAGLPAGHARRRLEQVGRRAARSRPRRPARSSPPCSRSAGRTGAGGPPLYSRIERTEGLAEAELAAGDQHASMAPSRTSRSEPSLCRSDRPV